MNSEIIREDRDFYTVMKAFGVLSAEKFITWINDYYKDRRFFRTIWDFRECDVTGVSKESYKDISMTIRDAAWGTQPHVTAVVMQSQHEQLMAKAFGTCANAFDLPIDFQPFLNIDDAVKWVEESLVVDD